MQRLRRIVAQALQTQGGLGLSAFRLPSKPRTAALGPMIMVSGPSTLSLTVDECKAKGLIAVGKSDGTAYCCQGQVGISAPGSPVSGKNCVDMDGARAGDVGGVRL